MKRRFSIALATGVLVGASLEAPFAHLHPGDPDHHHAQGLAHEHLGVHEHHDNAEGPEIGPHDDDALAIYLEWAPAAAQRVVVTAAAGTPAPIVAPVMARVGSAPEFAPRAHSPPAGRLLPARAPPV